MTQTLTTERLKELADPNMICKCSWDEYKSMASELLANREAQPVAIVESCDYVTAAQITGDEPRRKAVKEMFEGALVIGQHLYTAPPAPVVNPGFTGATAVPDGYCIMPLTLTAANGAKGALSGEFKISRTVRCHECGGEGCDDCADAGEFEEEITVPWDTIKDIYRAAVEACRAAMLAQPVSQGYKLVPVEPTPKQWAAGVKAMDAGMDKVTLVYKAMLATAPEGDNEK